MFITFEGIDGSGKSTQATLLRDRLQNDGKDVLLLREPGGVPLAEEIREILLNSTASVDPFAEMLLFSAARSQLVREKIKPAIENGAIVICDRFYDSTTAYQGGGRQLANLDWLTSFHLQVTDGLVPDLTFFIDLSVEEATHRLHTRTSSGTDRMEAENKAFFERVRTAYKQLADAHSDRIVVLDGLLPVGELHAKIVGDIHQVLNL